MGNTNGISRAFLLLAWALSPLTVTACAQTDADAKWFDISAQPVGPALNEFAKQADITLIFSYDLVADDRTPALKGRYAVNHGLSMLLEGTQLAYQQGVDGTYLICSQESCGPTSGLPQEESADDQKQKTDADGGNVPSARLHD